MISFAGRTFGDFTLVVVRLPCYKIFRSWFERKVMHLVPKTRATDAVAAVDASQGIFPVKGNNRFSAHLHGTKFKALTRAYMMLGLVGDTCDAHM